MEQTLVLLGGGAGTMLQDKMGCKPARLPRGDKLLLIGPATLTNYDLDFLKEHAFTRTFTQKNDNMP
jgi:hypothetical protein